MRRLKLDPKKYTPVELKLGKSFGYPIEWKRPVPSRYRHCPWLEDMFYRENVYNLLNHNGFLIIPHNISLSRVFHYCFRDKGAMWYTHPDLIEGLRDTCQVQVSNIILSQVSSTKTSQLFHNPFLENVSVIPSILILDFIF